MWVGVAVPHGCRLQGLPSGQPEGLRRASRPGDSWGPFLSADQGLVNTDSSRCFLLLPGNPF